RCAEPRGFIHFILEDVACPHSGSALREREADRATKPVRGTGDDRGLAAEVEVHAATPALPTNRSAMRASPRPPPARARASLRRIADTCRRSFRRRGTYATRLDRAGALSR